MSQSNFAQDVERVRGNSGRYLFSVYCVVVHLRSINSCTMRNSTKYLSERVQRQSLVTLRASSSCERAIRVLFALYSLQTLVGLGHAASLRLCLLAQSKLPAPLQRSAPLCSVFCLPHSTWHSRPALSQKLILAACMAVASKCTVGAHVWRAAPGRH